MENGGRVFAYVRRNNSQAQENRVMNLTEDHRVIKVAYTYIKTIENYLFRRAIQKMCDLTRFYT